MNKSSQVYLEKKSATEHWGKNILVSGGPGPQTQNSKVWSFHNRSSLKTLPETRLMERHLSQNGYKCKQYAPQEQTEIYKCVQ